jgi:hypothetical protein
VAEVPQVAVVTSVGPELAVRCATVADEVPRLRLADERRLGRAASLRERKLAVDELAVVIEHEPTVAARRDRSRVTTNLGRSLDELGRLFRVPAAPDLPEDARRDP